MIKDEIIEGTLQALIDNAEAEAKDRDNLLKSYNYALVEAGFSYLYWCESCQCWHEDEKHVEAKDSQAS